MLTKSSKTIELLFKTCFDPFGREVKKEVVGFDGNLVSTVKEYNTNGTLYRVSDPFTGSTPVNWTTYTYDDYKRPLTVTSPSGKVASAEYSDNSTESTVNDVTTTKNFDVTGLLASVVDPAGTMLYTYNPAGQPVSIQAPDGNTTVITYDAYGRQLTLADPAAGTMTYAYDSSGNLYTQQDARGLTTTVLYDSYGRTTTKTTPEFTLTYGYNTVTDYWNRYPPPTEPAAPSPMMHSTGP